MGYVNLWEAVVQGNATTSAIEFQIFQPHPEKNGVYNLIYGNQYGETHPQVGSSIIIPVDNTLHPPPIPARPGYVVGIRLRNNTDPNFGLQYINITSGAGGVDVYYWEGMGNQTCNLSVCDSNAGVLRGVIPLVSWRFCKLNTCTTTNNDYMCHALHIASTGVRSLFEFEIVNTVFFEVYLVLTPLNCLQATTPSCPNPTTTSVHHTSLQLASPPTPSPFLLTTPVTASPGI